MAKRIDYIDIAKGIGILLVVLGHNPFVSGFSLRLIYAFHMPLFFFLSGYFFNASLAFSELLKKRFHALLKPYFFVIVLIYFFHVSFGKLNISVAIGRVIKSLYGAGDYLEWFPMWFLPHLFLVSVFAFAVLRLRSSLKNNYLYYLLLLAMLAIGILTMDKFPRFTIPFISKSFIFIHPPYGADLLPVTAFFFLLGAEARQFVSKKWLGNWFLFAGSAIALIFASVYIPTRLDLATRSYPLPVINTIEAILGIWFALSLSRQIELRIPPLANGLKYLGRISLIILIFHYPLQSVWIGKIQAITDNPWMIEIGSFLAGVFGSVLLYELFIKANPMGRYWFGMDARRAESTTDNEATAT